MVLLYQCNASVQYFAIMHVDKYCTISENPIKLKIRFFWNFIRKNKRHSMIQQVLQQITFEAQHIVIVARQNRCVARQKLLAIR